MGNIGILGASPVTSDIDAPPLESKLLLFSDGKRGGLLEVERVDVVPLPF